MSVAGTHRRPTGARPRRRAARCAVAVDFDETLAIGWPGVAFEVPGALAAVRAIAERAKVILWTRRTGDSLRRALAWLRDEQIELFGVNRNPDEFAAGPKPDFRLLVDDRAIGCPLVEFRGRQVVAWDIVLPMVLARLESG